VNESSAESGEMISAMQTMTQIPTKTYIIRFQHISTTHESNVGLWARADSILSFCPQHTSSVGSHQTFH